MVLDLFENPPGETPRWHSSELETACLIATADWLVHMGRAVEDRAHAPAYMGDAFSKIDGTATVKFIAEAMQVMRERRGDPLTIGLVP